MAKKFKSVSLPTPFVQEIEKMAEKENRSVAGQIIHLVNKSKKKTK